MPKRRVVITGMGVISPVGNTASDAWVTILSGKSGITPITRFDASALASQIAGEVKGFDPAAYIEPKEIKKMDRFIHLAIAASQMAMDDSGLAIRPENADMVGVVVGAGIGHRGDLARHL